MSYQVLARKWRPKSFEELVGQEHVVQALVNGLDQDRIHHAFLLTSTRGVGKTTLARILAKCLNCEAGVSSTPCGECAACVDIDEGRFVDMIEIDAASRTGVDDTRELLESVQYTPTRGRFKVYIIDEVHMLSKHSFNALLKTLEEPPPHVKFVLATTDPQNIPVTILSRCLRFSLRRLLPDQITAHLQKLLAEEGVEAEATAVARIARAADGSMRDALSLLDQAIAFGGGRLEDDSVVTMLGSADHGLVAALIEACARGDAEDALKRTDGLVAESRDLEAVLVDMAEALHRCALLQLAPGFDDPSRTDWDQLRELAEQLDPGTVQLFYEIAIGGRDRMGLAPDPRTGFEMTLLRMLAFQPAAEGSAQGGGPRTVASKSAPETEQPTRAVASQRPSGPAAASERRPDRTDPQMPWPEFVSTLSLSGPARELARHLELKERGADRWRFVIPAALEHLAQGRPLERLEQAMAAALGATTRLDIRASEQPVQSLASEQESALNQRQQQARDAIDDDPTVRSLREQLGAEVVADSVRPLELDG